MLYHITLLGRAVNIETCGMNELQKTFDNLYDKDSDFWDFSEVFFDCYFSVEIKRNDDEESEEKEFEVYEFPQPNNIDKDRFKNFEGYSIEETFSDFQIDFEFESDEPISIKDIKFDYVTLSNYKLLDPATIYINGAAVEGEYVSYDNDGWSISQHKGGKVTSIDESKYINS